MSDVLNVILRVAELPPDRLVILVVLLALSVVGFALYVVLAVLRAQRAE